MSGKFITFEGTEGAGKSTQVARLAAALSDDLDVPVLTTREPGGTSLGETLRQVLLDPDIPPMDSLTELLLMFAARAEHLAQVIKPALANGQWVICDRFTDATYAYQGGGRGVPLDRIRALEQLVHDDLQPDLTVLLDIDLKEGAKRAAARGAPDRFEQERLVFFSAVREGYVARARAHDRIVIVNGAAAIDEIHDQIMCVVRERLS